MAMMWIRIMLLVAACMLPLSVEGMVRHYKFNVGSLHCIALHILHYYIDQFNYHAMLALWNQVCSIHEIGEMRKIMT